MAPGGGSVLAMWHLLSAVMLLSLPPSDGLWEHGKQK